MICCIDVLMHSCTVGEWVDWEMDECGGQVGEWSVDQ